MKIFFGFMAVLLYAGGFFGCTMAKTSIHEIQAGIVFIIATLFAVGAAILEGLHDLRPQPSEPRQPGAGPEAGA